MARRPDGGKRKRERLVAFADSQALQTLQQAAELIQSSPSAAKEVMRAQKTEWALQPHVNGTRGDPVKTLQVEKYGGKGKGATPNLMKTNRRGRKRKSLVERLAAYADIDGACARQLDKLRILVERFGRKLEDGWHVISQLRSKNGIPFFTFISPIKERFRSRLEVARHLGLPVRPPKSRTLGGTGLIAANSRLALVPYVRKNKSLGKVSSGISYRKSKIREGKPPKALNSISDVNEMQEVSTFSPSPSFITQQCQDVLRSLIATETFAALSKLLNQGMSATSLEANSYSTAPLFSAGSLDLQLIHLRLSTGAYGQMPELFSADIQQVWKNIITAGSELVILGHTLSELSDNLYKQQIKSLVDGPTKTNSDNKLGGAYMHVGPLPERNVATAVGMETGYRARRTGLSGKESNYKRSMPGTHQALRARLQRNLFSKKATSKARYQSKETVLEGAETPLELMGRLASNGAESFCQKCGLNKPGVECVVCEQCQASYHACCVGSNLTASGWCCPLCSSDHHGTENPWNGLMDEETRRELWLINRNATTEMSRELQKSTSETGVCEACKKADDNVLLCDGCDAAYHMSCLSPPMDSVPDGCWYCPACEEAGKKSIVPLQDTHVHNCVVCERVSRELSLCAENESTAQVFFKETSPVYPAPERSRDDGCAGQSLDQGASIMDPHCLVKKPDEGGYQSGAEKACKLCGKDEGKKSALCSNCRRYFHFSCLRPALRKRPRKGWFCPSCLCRACKTDADDDKILLCDACDEGYHMYCLKPPIAEIPVEAWYCPVCREVQNAAHTLPIKI